MVFVEPLDLSVDEVLEIRRQLVDHYGGTHGVRDRGYQNLRFSVHHPAAASMESLTNNHAFLDGNKRVAFAGADVFLRLNGFYLDIASVSGHAFITEQISARKFRMDAILKWIEQIAKKLDAESQR